MIRWFKEWRRKRKEKLFREYEAWKHAQNQPKPGTSFNCRCYVKPYPLTEKLYRLTADDLPAREKVKWEQKPLSLDQILVVGNLKDERARVKLNQKTKRKVKSKKKLTAGKHGKKLQTTKRKNKQ